MRKVIGLRYPLGSVPIKDIELDAESRDDIPAILIGLQAVYRNEATREELFRLLDEHVLPDRRRDTGRLGMDLWAIVVMGVLKQGLNCDYDRLHRLADKEMDVQRLLGHSPGVADGGACDADSSLNQERNPPKPPERGGCAPQEACRNVKKPGFSDRRQFRKKVRCFEQES